MEQIKALKEQLIGVIQGQMSNLSQVDAHELGAVVDMIKDLADTMKLCEEEKYYKTVTKVMEEREKEDQKRYQYIMPMMYPERNDYMGDYYRDMDRDQGRMYYGGPNGSGNRGNMGRGSQNNGQQGRDSMGRFTDENGRNDRNSGYDRDYPDEMRDHREGSSPIRRKYYMESKELHHDKKTQMEQLEKYMQELSKDVTEMIQGATPEETTLLKQKLATLIEKIK